MPIDGCKNTFAELALTVLPKNMQEIRRAMEDPWPLAKFCERGVGVKTIARQLNRTDDFSGCYVLLHHAKPFYVGISRGVVGRLRQHGTGTTHFDASLAYRIARERVTHKMTREAAMKDPVFRRAFEEAQQLLTRCTVAFIEIPNALELYLFEAYCAMELDTSRWNTFQTH
ncbi:MAG TPA: hypothetical protein VJO53_09710 [Candidatus Acidoferrales bacterium]|nr:hypothetical protein [Candidatus Acidoferrales bacterium]